MLSRRFPSAKARAEVRGDHEFLSLGNRVANREAEGSRYALPKGPRLARPLFHAHRKKIWGRGRKARLTCTETAERGSETNRCCNLEKL